MDQPPPPFRRSGGNWTRIPDLVARVRLFPTAGGGKRLPIVTGFGCPCMLPSMRSKAIPEGWDARLVVDGEPFEPGTVRRVGFVFLSPEGLRTMRAAGRFLLWEGRFVGEAVVIRMPKALRDPTIADLRELARQWDPIGVAPNWPDDVPFDEYDRYMRRLAERLRRGASIEEGARYLATVERDLVGGASEERAQRIVEALAARMAVPRE